MKCLQEKNGGRRGSSVFLVVSFLVEFCGQCNTGGSPLSQRLFGRKGLYPYRNTPPYPRLSLTLSITRFGTRVSQSTTALGGIA